MQLSASVPDSCFSELQKGAERELEASCNKEMGICQTKDKDEIAQHLGTANTSDVHEINWLQQVNVDPGESVEKGFGQPLAAAPLLQWILGCKDPEPCWCPERLPQLSNEDLFSVIQHCIQAFKHTLACVCRESSELSSKKLPLPSFGAFKDDAKLLYKNGTRQYISAQVRRG